MTKIISVLLALLFLTACGTLHKTSNSIETQSKVSTKTETTVATATETKTKIVEKVDTTLQVKADSVVAVRPLEDLLQGKPIEATDGNNTVIVTYDELSGSIRAVGITEAHDVPVTMERTIETDEKIAEVEEKKEAVVDEQKETIKEETKDRKSGGFSWGIVVTLTVIVVILLFIVFRRARDRLIR